MYNNFELDLSGRSSFLICCLHMLFGIRRAIPSGILNLTKKVHLLFVLRFLCSGGRVATSRLAAIVLVPGADLLTRLPNLLPRARHGKQAARRAVSLQILSADLESAAVSLCV